MDGSRTPLQTADEFLDAVREQVGEQRLSEILDLRSTAVPKEDGSFVTRGDLLVQRIILDLATSCFQDPVFVSEEMPLSAESGRAEQVVIVVDPIDGTENFTSGLYEWGVSISCFQHGAHVASMLGAPEMKRWLRSGRPIKRHRSRIRGLSSSLSKDQIAGMATSPEYRILGCCVINMMSVITGSFVSFENPKGARTWDILAGLNLALEHGLSVMVDGVPYQGEYLDPSKRYKFRITHPEDLDGRDPSGLI